LFHFLLHVKVVLFDVGHEEVHKVDLSMQKLENVKV
jgi:hypothetical protein